MDANEYQDRAMAAAVYPACVRLVYPTLGLLGEAAEVAEKVLAGLFPAGRPANADRTVLRVYDVLTDCIQAGRYAERLKKDLRDSPDLSLSDDARAEMTNRTELYLCPEEDDPAHLHGLKKEVAGVQWYVSATSHECGFRLGDVMDENLKQLASRAARGKIHGSGDDR